MIFVSLRPTWRQLRRKFGPTDADVITILLMATIVLAALYYIFLHPFVIGEIPGDFSTIFVQFLSVFGTIFISGLLMYSIFQ